MLFEKTSSVSLKKDTKVNSAGMNIITEFGTEVDKMGELRLQ